VIYPLPLSAATSFTSKYSTKSIAPPQEMDSFRNQQQHSWCDAHKWLLSSLQQKKNAIRSILLVPAVLVVLIFTFSKF